MSPLTEHKSSPAAKIYVWIVTIAGAIAVIESTKELVNADSFTWTYLVVLTVLSGLLSVRLPLGTISVSETFVFAGTLIFGRAVGTVLVMLDALVLSGKVVAVRKQVDWAKTGFNLTAPPLSIWLASSVLLRIIHAPLTGRDFDHVRVIFGLAIFTVLYFLLNSSFVAFAISFEQGRSPFRVWKEHFSKLSLNYFGGASIAALIVFTRGGDNSQYIVIFTIAPLMFILYYTYKWSMERVEEAQKRTEEVNRVHLATIEALAMAIDAKDQVTHGHIRRVQHYTMALARALGVKDDKQLKALQAAALLHDTGKLAVPEYILNKPGPLTTSEYERMKLHAAVGADILKGIDFPYPVEPIVRHHHENWDGSGYPEGLRGQRIPLGARVLSVVDCYDALTSDRPYRPRMTRLQAEQILRDRRNTMYDPWVVDGFLAILDRLEQSDDGSLSDSGNLKFNVPRLTPAQLDVISATTAEEREFAELRRELPKAGSLADACDVLFRHVRRVVPAGTVVLYVPVKDTNELVALKCSGVGSSTFEASRVPVGERVSGWAYAHRQAVLNSDASLELGPVARTFQTPLRYAMAVPLLDGSQSLGVLTLYGSELFDKDHRRLLESAAGLFVSSASMLSSSESAGPVARDPRMLGQKLH